MRRTRQEENVSSSLAPTIPMHPLPRPRTAAKGLVLVLAVVLLLDALVALPMGWLAARYHLASDVVALFAPSRPPSVSAPPLSPSPPLTPTPPAASQPSGVSEDTFQRPDQSFWGTASDGELWRADATTNPAFSVVEQAGRISASSGALTALLGPRLGDTELIATLSCSQFDGATNMGIVVRWSDPAHWYKLSMDGRALTLIKRDAATTTRLGATPFQAQPGVSYTLRTLVRGSMFFARAWSAASSEPDGWLLLAADPSASWSSGYGGLRMYFQSEYKVTVTALFFREVRLP